MLVSTLARLATHQPAPPATHVHSLSLAWWLFGGEAPSFFSRVRDGGPSPLGFAGALFVFAHQPAGHAGSTHRPRPLTGLGSNGLFECRPVTDPARPRSEPRVGEVAAHDHQPRVRDVGTFVEFEGG
eukprot:595663-Pyramimonas_sp.AAC.1